MQETRVLFRPPSGFTMVEMISVLALLGLGLATLLPAARRQLDRMSVLAVREEVVGLLHRARQEAISRGGSELVLNTQPPSAGLIVSSDTLLLVPLGEDGSVTLLLSRNRVEARLHFGPLGLGRVSSQTLRFRKGEEEASLVVSALGRVVRK